MHRRPDLNPSALKSAAGDKITTDREFCEVALTTELRPMADICQDANENFEMSRASAYRYIRRLVKAGLVEKDGVKYKLK